MRKKRWRKCLLWSQYDIICIVYPCIMTHVYFNFFPLILFAIYCSFLDFFEEAREDDLLVRIGNATGKNALPLELFILDSC